MQLNKFVSGFIGILAICGPAFATELDEPRGIVVLTISGDVPTTNVDQTAQFDLEMLMAMPKAEYQTSTIWTEGIKSFVGVPLKALLASVGVTTGSTAATAINDYAVDIPLESLTDEAPIIAYEMDGSQLSVRQKGPLWVVYPYDSDVDFQSEVIYSRSIWQLDRMVVK